MTDGSRDARGLRDDLVRAADRLLVGLDFDGVLAPIVDDPETARIHPEGPAMLEELTGCVLAVSLVTGRPAAKAVELGRLREVGQVLESRGHTLHVRGQYGNESWSSADDEVHSPEPPEGLRTFVEALPAVLERHDAADAWVEQKGLAVAVHTRRLADPQEAFERLLDPLGELAEEHGLDLEPGKRVIEVRSPGMDKGRALRDLAQELGAEAFLFIGDDFGDVSAFQTVRELREHGDPGLVVFAGSEEHHELAERADVVVDGPDGVMAWLREFAADVRSQRRPGVI